MSGVESPLRAGTTAATGGLAAALPTLVAQDLRRAAVSQSLNYEILVLFKFLLLIYCIIYKVIMITICIGLDNSNSIIMRHHSTCCVLGDQRCIALASFTYFLASPSLHRPARQAAGPSLLCGWFLQVGVGAADLQVRTTRFQIRQFLCLSAAASINGEFCPRTLAQMSN